MGDGTAIEWTDATWNPITGCEIESPGCANCYAMKLAGGRLRNHPSRKGLTKPSNAGPVWTGEVRLNGQWLAQPGDWKEPRRVFVVAHGDLFGRKVPDDWIDIVFAAMGAYDQHEYQVLTKRPDRAFDYLAGQYRLDDIYAQWAAVSGAPREVHSWPLRRVLIGTSIEDQKRADERRASLRAVAKVGWPTFVSYEPALGPVDWTGWEFVKWMISGGESGGGARPTHPDWHRATRDWCARHGIPYLFKQWGSWSVLVDRDNEDPDWRADYGVVNSKPGYRILNAAGGFGFHGERVCLMRHVSKKTAGRLLDGVEHNGFPARA